jgi:hypothetical protein
MIHVSFVCGHERCSARTTGTTWHVSPSDESLNMQAVGGGPSGGNFTESIR